MKTPITYYGGKQNMVSYILPNIPEHKLYVEPFFGGGAVFFAKPPSEVEVINDTNQEVTNFYKVVKTNYNVLYKEISTTLHSRDQHRQARVVYENPDMFGEVKRAWAFWTLANMSFSSSLTGGWGFANCDSKTTLRLVNKKANFIEEYKKRLDRVQIECNDALRVIQLRDTEYAFHYCDPPYYNANMGHYGGYTLQDFTNLLEVLSKIKGKFMLSSYPSDILDQYKEEHGWHQVTIDKRISVTSKTNKTKTEALTANYGIRLP